MGLLINGQWHNQEPLAKTDQQGHFIRPDSQFRSWVNPSASSQFPAEENRFHLYFSYACPWACRALILRKLKGLEATISASSVKPLLLKNGWEFAKKGSESDPLQHKQFLYELYCNSQPDYSGKVTVPVLWDKKQQTIVNNESADIIRFFNEAFEKFSKSDYDSYPKAFQAQINELNNWIYEPINNGVYRCGFAKSQEAYEEAFDQLFKVLDKLESLLSSQYFLITDHPVETDWRLFTTLIRFDVVYFSHFKCNRNRISDFNNLKNYLKRLYDYPGVKETVRFDHIKTHYYGSHQDLNPTGIIPKGPDLATLFS